MFALKEVKKVDRTILHVDANCFYASVECLHNPAIRNKPVAVVGDVEKRHGIVLTANYIAKKQNVKTGDVVWEAKRKCPELVLVETNMPLYIKFSRLMNEILLDYSDNVESFGCDESWVDVTHSAKIGGSGMEIAKKISERVKSELGITVSIGVSFNKVFAKLGSDLKKPDAITQITRENYKDVVWPLPVSNLLMVGRKTTKKLEDKNIKTIGDLANTKVEYLKAWLGQMGAMLYDFANGLDFSEVSKYSEKNLVKSIGNSTTTYRDLVNNEDIKMVLYVLADSVARRLREQGLYSKVISIWIKDNRLSSFTRQYKMEKRTDISGEIFKIAFELFKSNYNWYYPVRALGITASDLSQDREYEQITIYNDQNKKEQLEKLECVQDDLKRRFGSFCVRRGILLKDNELTGFDPKIMHTVHPVSFF